MQKGFVGIFEAESVIKTLLLCILTVGAYLIYKLYNFSNLISQKTEYKISKLFIVTTILLFTMHLGSLIYALANLHDPAILIGSISIHIVSSIFDVTWIIMVRNRINLIAGSKRGDKLWLKPLITSVFHVIYMQHKINQGLAMAQDNKRILSPAKSAGCDVNPLHGFPR
ncbi:hypothetical protein SAMN05660691_00140 [Rheinheimera pacifica]|uniref:DUF4234 domain-containing protein n=1 Tax=Rheinheimera pacifica TaxID=173990 RepID=A0A1H6JB64_9GAMM|nr:hypothetical protein [Rheinheimera pacifica]SEH56053.1 hypothetical protein SAMN05660691_00140 [Rheinheimera pacifica]